MERQRYPILLKNEISVYILLQLWPETVFKHFQVTNAVTVGSEKKKGPYTLTELRAQKMFSFGGSRTCSVISCAFSVPHILTLWWSTLPLIRKVASSLNNFVQVLCFLSYQTLCTSGMSSGGLNKNLRTRRDFWGVTGQIVISSSNVMTADFCITNWGEPCSFSEITVLQCGNDRFGDVENYVAPPHIYISKVSFPSNFCIAII
jgi:hypothetical protein